MRSALSIAALVLISCVSAGCGTSSSSPSAAAPTSSSPAAEPGVFASDIWQEFTQNEGAAGLKYTGKTMPLNGWVKHVRSDAKGMYIGLQVISPGAYTKEQIARMGEQEKKWLREGYPPNVLCYLAADQEAEAAKIKSGGNIEFTGQITGSKGDPDVWRGRVLLIENCRITKVEQP